MDDAVPFYSVRSAITGSFFAAAEAGMSPEMSVSTTLMRIMRSAEPKGRCAMFGICVSG